MNNATLEYVISDNSGTKNILLESGSLFNVDQFTCDFKNENDFINKYQNKDVIYNFIRDNNNIKGRILINYKNNEKENKEILPLFNAKDIFVYNNDSITDLERAKRLLYSSKNQLFIKLVFSEKLFDSFLNNLLDLTTEESLFLSDLNYKVYYINGKNYISFKSLLEYRLNVLDLNIIKNAFNRMLDELSKSIFKLDDDEYYFYNRQIRLLLDKYYDLTAVMSIKNFKIVKLNKKCNYVLKITE